MILRLFVPPLERPDADAEFGWALMDRRGEGLREGAGPLVGLPRADEVQAILPASRVLYARLKLPRVNATTIRELLPFAVEDRLLADPAHIHAVAGRTDPQGETVVAVVDRVWLEAVVDLLSRAGFAPAHAWCESALHVAQDGRWIVVLGATRNYLLESGGVAVPFDRPAGSDLPLAIRIAVDEARARGNAPTEIRVVVEPGAATAEPAAWREQTGVPVAAVTATANQRAAPIAADSIDLLAGDFSPASSRFSGLRIPRLAVALACVIAILQIGLSAFDWWRMEGARRALEAERVAIFQAAFPEARTIVDPALQMSRNLAELQRSRGQPAGDDFLALATAAAAHASGPAKRLRYGNGKLDVERGEAGK